MACRRGTFGDVLGALVELVAQTSDSARRESTGDDSAQPVVVVAIHIDQDHRLHIDVLTSDIVGELREGGVGTAGIDVVPAGNFFDVFMPGDGPVTAVVESTLADLLLTPPHRSGSAELREFVDRQPLHAEVWIQKI